MRVGHPAEKFIDENGGGPGLRVTKAAPEEELSRLREEAAASPTETLKT
jgi:hypothetical protein